MEELIKALKVIKDECKKYDSSKCKLCPMGDANGECCVATRIPKHWDITEPTSVVRIMDRR